MDGYIAKPVHAHELVRNHRNRARACRTGRGVATRASKHRTVRTARMIRLKYECLAPPVESRVFVNGVEIALWEWPGEGPPVLFCHATGFHARIWDQVIALLPEGALLSLSTRAAMGAAASRHRPTPGETSAPMSRRWLNPWGSSARIGVGHSLGGHAVTLGAALQPAAFAALVLFDPVIRAKRSVSSDLGKRRRSSRSGATNGRRQRRCSSASRIGRRSIPGTGRVLRDYCEHALQAPDGDGYMLACPPDNRSFHLRGEHGGGIEHLSGDRDHYRFPCRWSAPDAIATPRTSWDRRPQRPIWRPASRAARILASPEHSHFIPMESPELAAKLDLQTPPTLL